MRTKLISLSSPLYAKRMATEINNNQLNFPYFKMMPNEENTPPNGRRIISAWTRNGVLFGRSLNGVEFAINVECVFDGNDRQVCVSRVP